MLKEFQQFIRINKTFWYYKYFLNKIVNSTNQNDKHLLRGLRFSHEI